ncbi:MAG: 5-formyltetrahydrofolate cyclo-ligase [Halioglobus sp.]
MNTTSTDKPELRKILRQRRNELSAEAQGVAAEAISHHIAGLPEWHSAKQIALYHDADCEIGTGPLLAACLNAGKTVYLPVVRDNKTLEFAHWYPEQHTQVNQYGITEPGASAARVAAAELDLVFLPLVGWDQFGNRLGMGAGYYDRALARHPRVLKVGLAHSFQEVDEIPSDAWDIALDVVLTETGIHRCSHAV